MEDYHPFLQLLPEPKEFIKDIIYVSNCFIVASEKLMDEEGNEMEQTLKVVNDNGAILKTFRKTIESWTCLCEFSVYETNRLLFFNIREMIIFNIEELLSEEANQISFKSILDLQQLPEEGTEPGLLRLVKNHTSLAILNVVGKTARYLHMRKLDFWNVE